MVIVVETYRGFELRIHEAYFDDDPLNRGARGTFCVHCPEGTQKTYSNLKQYLVLPYDWTSDAPLWNKASINPIRASSYPFFREGHCTEDKKYVIAHNYLVGEQSPEEAGVGILAARFKRGIDSLWDEAMQEFPEEFRFYDSRHTTKTA